MTKIDTMGTSARDLTGTAAAASDGIAPEARQFVERATASAKQLKAQHTQGTFVPSTRDNGGSINPFPARFAVPDDYDERAVIKQRLAAQSGLTAFATQDDVDHAARKAKIDRAVKFDQFLGRTFDLKNGGELERIERTIPEYLNNREMEIDRMAALQARWAKLALRGPRDRADYELQFMVENGEIQIPTGELFNPQPMTDQYIPGIFSILGKFDDVRTPLNQQPGSKNVRMAQFNVASTDTGMGGGALGGILRFFGFNA